MTKIYYISRNTFEKYTTIRIIILFLYKLSEINK